MWTPLLSTYQCVLRLLERAMTTPNQSESERFNEPELLEAEGFLNRAWRRLGEGLGPFVADKTGKGHFKGSRDVYAILSEMENSWNTHFRTIGHDERDRSPRSWVIDLLSFRNGPWAHLNQGQGGMCIRLRRGIGLGIWQEYFGP